MYKIITTKTFVNGMFKYFEKKEFIKFNKYREKLNPYLGDIVRVNYVREFRLFSGKRAYFIIYCDLKIILFIKISNKKNQNIIINEIFNNLKEFKKYVSKI